MYIYIHVIFRWWVFGDTLDKERLGGSAPLTSETKMSNGESCIKKKILCLILGSLLYWLYTVCGKGTLVCSINLNPITVSPWNGGNSLRRIRKTLPCTFVRSSHLRLLFVWISEGFQSHHFHPWGAAQNCGDRIFGHQQDWVDGQPPEQVENDEYITMTHSSNLTMLFPS